MAIKFIRQSMLNLYCHCQEAFRRRYIEGEIIPPAIAMTIGTGVHKAAEINHKQKISSGMDMPIDDMLDAAADGFMEAVEADGVYFQGTRQELMKELGIAQTLAVDVTKVYGREIAPQIQPIEAELTLYAQHPDLPIPFRGTVDVLDVRELCIDLKTARVKWRAGKERDTVQPAIYRYMLFENFARDYDFGFHVMTYKGETQYIPAPKSNQEMAYIVALCKSMMNSIRTGDFMPAVPGHWLCSDKWCGYWFSCKYSKG